MIIRSITEQPDIALLEDELKRINYRHRYFSILRSTIYILIVVASVSVLVATMWMPVLKICGNSMTPTLQNGEIVICVKTVEFETGDIVAFYYDNKLLIKRVICGPDGEIFVMGDHRSTSVDSLSKSIGCVAQEQVVGKILFRVWPLGEFGVID